MLHVKVNNKKRKEGKKYSIFIHTAVSTAVSTRHSRSHTKWQTTTSGQAHLEWPLLIVQLLLFCKISFFFLLYSFKIPLICSTFLNWAFSNWIWRSLWFSTAHIHTQNFQLLMNFLLEWVQEVSLCAQGITDCSLLKQLKSMHFHQELFSDITRTPP